ncbi:MAG: hypothetical protein OFPII_06100 [Osedax symbiont Rs1]|nr:MAG: hypothetical protein OFPII_06100 [Osedax symbiont Rs1]
MVLSQDLMSDSLEFIHASVFGLSAVTLLLATGFCRFALQL